MREILFRGKRIDNGEWIEGCLYYDQTGVYIKYPEKSGRFGCGCPVVPETVGQFTNLLDKNDKRIWERDIFELVNVDGELVRGMVKYGIHQRIMDSGWLCDIPSFSFVVGDRNTFPIVKNYKGVHDLTIIEVLGNVFDNPELLNNSNTTQL